MGIRTFFMLWLDTLPFEQYYEVDLPKFFSIPEREYFLEAMAGLKVAYPKLEKYIEDYAQLEQFRFDLIDGFKTTPEQAQNQFKKALEFCKSTLEDKRNYSFKVNEEIPKFITHSKFQWYGNSTEIGGDEGGSYLFAPSILNLPPQELVLNGLNSLLLDLKDYGEVFSYNQFLDLVSNNLGMDRKEMDPMLLEFMTEQVLYYRTLVPYA